tara:strand:+ start:1174 stop:1869 length:696 start_codon:yes stop_codon:yes gene_type:complete
MTCDNFILEIPNAFTADWCNDMIKTFNEHPEMHKVGGFADVNGKLKTDDLRKKDTEIGFDPSYEKNEVWGDKVCFLIDEMAKYINVYIDKYSFPDNIFPDKSMNGLAGISPLMIEADFNMQKFEPNEGFKQWHTETVSDRNSYRQIVWSIYLNTINEKGGTEFKFQNYRCAAEQGKLVMWPAGWTHFHKSEVAPKETKYIITGWVMYKETGGSIGIEQGSMNEPPPFIQLG